MLLSMRQVQQSLSTAVPTQAGSPVLRAPRSGELHACDVCTVCSCITLDECCQQKGCATPRNHLAAHTAGKREGRGAAVCRAHEHLCEGGSVSQQGVLPLGVTRRAANLGLGAALGSTALSLNGIISPPAAQANRPLSSDWELVGGALGEEERRTGADGWMISRPQER